MTNVLELKFYFFYLIAPVVQVSAYCLYFNGNATITDASETSFNPIQSNNSYKVLMAK